MVREKRRDHEGAWHHVMHRGARRALIFRKPEDCVGFLAILEEAVDRFGLEIHAYSLMPNHYHLLVRSVFGNLSKGMQHLSGTYTLWLNKRHRWDGPVFRGRFKSQLIDNEEHLRILLAYIHLNPLQANLVTRLTSESWTSHLAYIGKETVPEWLTTQLMLDLLGGSEGLHRFVLSVHRKAVEWPEDFNLDTGLFRKKAASKQVPLQEDQAKGKGSKRIRHKRLRSAEEVLKDVCRICKVDMRDLMRRESGPGANPPRRFAIWALNYSADVTQRDIVRILDVSYHQVTRLLSRLRKQEVHEPLKEWMRLWLV